MIYGVTGMPLAGKTTVAEVLEEEGFTVVDMGDVVREEMEKEGVPEEETGEWVTQQRKDKGRDAIAQLTAPYLQETGEKTVITGMRSLEEKERFEHELEEEIEIIAVWASPETRKKRMEERERLEDKVGDSFKQRDKRELEQGVGDLTAVSDHLIKNEGTQKQLEEKVMKTVNTSI